jgi:predicted TIM-barrel fold metal-dependent hydrolase
MIIDFHCHAGRGDKMTAPWNTDAPIEPYLRRARAAGIDRTVVFAPFHSDYALANAEVARIVDRHKPRLIGFAFIHARRDAGRVFEMVNTAVTRYGFRGIKIHGFDAMPTREVCDAARAFNLPLLVDVIDQASVVEMLASQFPSVNFIIPHLGSFRDDWKAQQQVVDQLVRYPNVFADTSGVRRFDYIVAAVRRAGAQKLIFGSDGPWLHPGLELYKVRLLGLTARAQSQVLGGNAARLLRGTRTKALRPQQIVNRPISPAPAFEPPFHGVSSVQLPEYEL